MQGIITFEILTYRKMLRISWTAHIMNEEVLHIVGKKRGLFLARKIRKTTYFVYIFRNDKHNIVQLIIKVNISGNKISVTLRSSPGYAS